MKQIERDIEEWILNPRKRGTKIFGDEMLPSEIDPSHGFYLMLQKGTASVKDPSAKYGVTNIPAIILQKIMVGDLDRRKGIATKIIKKIKKFISDSTYYKGLKIESVLTREMESLSEKEAIRMEFDPSSFLWLASPLTTTSPTPTPKKSLYYGGGGNAKVTLNPKYSSSIAKELGLYDITIRKNGKVQGTYTVPQPHSKIPKIPVSEFSKKNVNLRIEASDIDQIARVAKALGGEIVTVSRDFKSAIVKV